MAVRLLLTILPVQLDPQEITRMTALYFSFAFTGIAAITFLGTRWLDKRVLVVYALAAAVYVGADDFATGLPSIFKSLSLDGADWNWTGKFLSLALSAIVVVALKLAPDAVGLTLKQRSMKVGLIGLVFFIVWGVSLGLLFKPGVPDAETLLFQATMPGIAEELVYRGIAPAILLGLLRQERPPDGIPWAVIAATSIVFGVWHGLEYSGGSFGFNAMSALFPFVGSIPGGWLRYKTGSLVFPVLAHSVANVAFHVAGGMAA
jgi:uncharacterized protein